MGERFVMEIDEDRLKGGWGHWYWVVDTRAVGVDRLLCLLPKELAEIEAARLNRKLSGLKKKRLPRANPKLAH
jgi:hypothetical protein